MLSFSMTKYYIFFDIILFMFINISSAKWVNDDANWMSYIAGDLTINQINIPGTHDSATYSVEQAVAGITKTQNYNIRQQLESGIRYLDVRLGDIQNNQVGIVHGLINCKVTLNQVLSDCVNFLNMHRTETVIVHLKNDRDCKMNGTINCNEDRNRLVNSIIGDQRYFYAGRDMPTLDSVRGRVVIATREDRYNGIYLPIPDLARTATFSERMCGNLICVNQDGYELDNDSKWAAVKSLLDRQSRIAQGSDARTVAINFLSLSTDILEWVQGRSIERVSSEMNSRFLQQGGLADSQNLQFGWIVGDYFGPEISRYVYQSNRSNKLFSKMAMKTGWDENASMPDIYCDDPTEFKRITSTIEWKNNVTNKNGPCDYAYKDERYREKCKGVVFSSLMVDFINHNFAVCDSTSCNFNPRFKDTTNLKRCTF